MMIKVVSIFLSLIFISVIKAAVKDYSPLGTAILDDNVTLNYRMITSEDIELTLTAQTTGFVALGLKFNSSDYDVIWGTNSEVNDYYSLSEAAGVADTDDGGANDLTFESGSQSSGVTTIVVQRKLNTGDSFDAQIELDQTIDIFWAIAKSDAADQDALELDFSGSGNVVTGSVTFATLEWLSADLNLLTLYWYINEATSEIEMLMDGDTTGYVSVGFGPSMDGADCYLGYYSGSNLIIRDTWSYTDNNPPLDTSRGGTDDVYGAYGERSGSRTYVGFRRLLDTGDDQDIAVVDGDMDIIWAISRNDSDARADHGSNYGSGVLNFYTGDFNKSDGFSGREVHGIIMTITWGFIPPFFRWTYRYFSHNKTWIWIHLALGVLVCILHFVALQMLHLGNESEGVENEGGDWGLHETFGGFMAWLLGWQTISGLVSAYVMKWAHKKIPYISRMHGWGAYGIIAFAILSIILGFLLVWPKYLWIIILWIVFVFTVEAGLYYYTRYVQRKEMVNTDNHVSTKYMVTKTVSNYTEFMEEVALFPKKSFILMQNYILDITGYAVNHPGGAYIFKNLQPHDDISRWIYGNYGLDSKTTNHIHTVAAEKYIYEKLIYGGLAVYQDCIQPRSMIIKQKSDNEEDKSLSTIAEMTNSWTLSHVQELTKDTSQFYFHSDTMKCNPNSIELENLGRHFKVTTMVGKLPVSRLYTSIFALSNTRVKSRNSDTARIGARLNNSVLMSAEQVTDYPLIDEKLNIVAKVYTKAKLTPFLFGTSQHSNKGAAYVIEGPQGLGLCLDANSSGRHIIFGAGTGMFPFMDLFDFYLTQLIKWNDSNEKGAILDKLQVTVYGSYASRKNCVGLSLMEKCQVLAKSKEFDGFDLNLFFRDEKKQNFDNAFIEERKVELRNASKIYICGPPRFNEEIPQSLINLGVPYSKMFFI